MEYKDYYKILGVKRDASAEEIKTAYRKLARQHHPDINKAAGAEAKFKEIGEAYDVLKDTEKRKAYDALGSDYQPCQHFRPPPDWQGGFQREEFGDMDSAAFGDLFEAFSRRAQAREARGRQNIKMRGADHHAQVFIDLEDAYNGATRAISLRAEEIGDDGRLHLRDRTLNVKIPKGVRPGQHIRLGGQGGAGIGGGPAGDLYLDVAFNPHPIYRVDGKDVYADLPIAPWEAALGRKVTAPTLDGAVSVAIPAGSAAGKQLRLKGRGIPGDPPGDLYLVLQIALPPADSEDAKRLYADMEKKLPFNPRSHLGV